MTITWITINVQDFDASKAFYRDYLGLKSVREFSPTPKISIAFFSDDKGMEVELIQGNSADPTTKANVGVSIGIRVTNDDALLEDARSQGILIGEPAMLGPDVECFFVRDPSGVGVQVNRER